MRHINDLKADAIGRGSRAEYDYWAALANVRVDGQVAAAQSELGVTDRTQLGLIAGHRAGLGEAPENSLEAIQHCIDNGITLVELDVFKSDVDGSWLVHHDTTVTRTTDGSGNTVDFSGPEFRGLSIDDGHTWPHDATSVTVEDVVKLFKGKATFMWEPKDQNDTVDFMAYLDTLEMQPYSVIQTSAAAKIADIVAAGYTPYAYWAAADPLAMAGTIGAYPDAWIGWSWTGFSESESLVVVNYNATQDPPRLLMPYGIKYKSDMADLGALGVDGVTNAMTDFPNYIASDGPRLTEDPWDSGYPESVVFRGTNYPKVVDGALEVIAASNEYHLIGDLSPYADADGSYTITVDVALDPATSGAIAIGIAEDDDKYWWGTEAAPGYPSGWHIYMRYGGQHSIFQTSPDGDLGSGASAGGSYTNETGNVSQTAFTTDVFKTVVVTVTPTTVSFTVDGGAAISTTTSGRRGAYLYLGKTGTSATAKFKNLSIAPV